MSMWQPISGVSDPVVIRDFSGVYLPDDEGFNLPDNLFTELINFSPDNYPAITTRPGYSAIGQFGKKVTGLGAWKGETLVAAFNDGTWRVWNGTTWSDPVFTFGSSDPEAMSAPWSFVNFRGNLDKINLIGVNGRFGMIRYDGVSTISIGTAPSGAKFIEQHDNRLYIANDNTVRFSALSEVDDWTTVDDAGEIIVETSDGEVISAIKSGPKHLVVFKPNSMHDLLGSGPASYTLIPVAADIGAINNNCTVNIGGMIYFLHTTGVYSYASARPRKDFCKPIMAYIERINLSALSKCSIGSDGLNLYVSLPLDNSPVPNIILQYNLERGIWHTWSDYTAVVFSFMNGDTYIGNDDGSVRKVGGLTNGGTAIVGTAISKPFTAESMARKSHWLKLWVVASITSGRTLSVYISGEASGDNWKLSKTLTADSSIQYKEILVPLNSVAAANAVRIKLVAVGQVSIHEITRQFRQLPMRR